MSGDTTAQLIWGVGALALVGSSLAARRLPLAQSLKMALAWVAIFAGVFVLFLFRGEAGSVWRRATAEFRGDAGVVEGRTLGVARSDDGHFRVRGTVNGVAVDFLIDSGATVTTLSAEAAAATHVEIGGGFPVALETANGMATARRASARALAIGPIVQHDPPLLVSDGLGETNLLGMSFLKGLKRWRVEGDSLVLEP
ncbi:MAG: TIGR02281 family clan AA aspartic protease [Sphingomonadaceae bacterium]|nr:TIGR02281 family clan AA aspartic protease [Sphingomonadaceae bacterium]